MSYLIQQGVEIRVARAELLADGRKRLTRFISFKQNGEFPLQLSYAYGDLDPFNGTFPTGWDDLRLVKVEADNSPANNGAGNDPVLAVTYEEPGTVTQRDDTGNNGALLTRTIVSFYPTPATPSGYTLVSENVENVNGYPYKAYKFVKGTGEISRAIDYGQSDDQGTTGVTRTTIRYLVVPSATVQPTSLAGSVEIARNMEEGDGYRIWTTTWAKGAGLVLDETTTSASGALKVYHRVQLGSAPTTPTQTLGGTVTLFEESVRNAEGFTIYDYRWAEGDGQASITTEGEPDGALVYTVVDLNVAAATPAYPGGGTAYLIRLTQKPESGYFVNTAIYKKPPATVGFRKTMKFVMPGLASISGAPVKYTLSPPVTRELLATVTVSYGTTQDTTTPYTVSTYATLNTQYIAYANPGSSPTPGSPPADTTTLPPVGTTESLGGYLASSSGTSGTNAFFEGVFCLTYEQTLGASSPSSRPTGATTLAVDNDPYLTATDGTVVFRRTVTTYSF